MVKVKICGLRRKEDIAYINAYPITYAGFIFAPSKRQVSLQVAHDLIQQLQSAIPVGVFVNAPIEEILKTVSFCKLQIIQLHGDEDATYIHQLKKQTTLPIWKALRIHTEKDVQNMNTLPVERYLLDAYSMQSYGGTGQSIDYEILANTSLQDVIVAGGISSETLEKVCHLHPYAIDASSSLEVDGYKNKEKIATFMKKLEEVNR